jgi:two-component system response regulator FixJ
MSDDTIYIVDDDEAVRDSLALLLESAGYRPRCYASGLELLAETALAPESCVVLDVRMPDIDGLELQQRLLAKHPALPIVVMTGHGDVPIAVRAMKQGACDFLEKPFSIEVLLEAIEQAAERRRLSQGDHQQAQGIRQRLAGLTPREREVLDALVAGHPNKVIAYQLSISPRTVEIHRARVMEKMEARSLSHLVRMALQAGLAVAPE